MKRILLLVAVLLFPVAASATITDPVEQVNNACGATTSCSVTVSAIGVGHLLVVVAHIGNTQTLSSVTAAGETFTVITASGGAGLHCPFNGGGNTTQVGCAYVLKSVGGATTVTCNWSGTAIATNTSCGFYDVTFNAPRVFLENNSLNSSHGSATTFAGVNFGNNYTSFINGTNDIIFQFANVSTGTPTGISSPFVLDNAAGQIADAHRINTFDNTPPTWTNSVAASSIVAGLSFGEDYNPNTVAIYPATMPNNGLQLSYSGSVGTRLVNITAPNVFQVAFDEGDGWGLAVWYDLVNDPGKLTNILGPAYPSGGTDITIAEPAVFERVYYDLGDTKQYCRCAQYYFPTSPRQLSVLEYTPSRIVIETKSQPCVTSGETLNNLIGKTRYSIYPNGQIYIQHVATVTNAVNIVNGIFSVVILPDPTQTGTTPPDTQGWIRASATQNPYSSVSGGETYLFSYWGSGTPAPYTNYTKASILMVRSPNNLHDNSQVIHSWGSGPGNGTVRWGWNTSPEMFAIGAGGTEVEDWLIQLGTQGSAILPNITSSAVAGPIAAAYIASPSPPAPIAGIAPVVNQGATMQFTSTDPGTWSNPAGTGSITVGGLYTAPATVTPQQTLGGYQLLPNQHVFNSRVDSLPLRSDSATLMAGTGTTNLTYVEVASFPINYCNASTPLQSMLFNATAGNNGNFQIPTYPNVRIETGWLNRWDGNSDHHLVCIDTTNGTVQETYQLRSVLTTTAASVNGSNLATLTFATNPLVAGFWVGESVAVTNFSGGDTYFNGNPVTLTAVTSTTVSYAVVHGAASASTTGTLSMEPSAPGTTSGSGIRYLNSTYNLPNTQAGSTDAAGLYLEPLALRVQEVEQAVATSGTIKHALRMTLQQGFVCGSSTANACYVGQPNGSRHIWPGTAEAFTGGGLNPFGLRYRLKAAYNCGALSSIAQILCTQLKQYGLILSDIGTGWSIIGEQGPWPANILAAFTELSNAAIQGASNFEVVDESGLEAAANQTCPVPDNCGLTTNNPETVTLTRTTDSTTASLSVALMGPGVTLPNDVYYIQAGMAAQQLTAFVNGGATNTVTWSVSPAITGGSLTSGGLLTPPATIAAVTPYTVTATSVDNGAVAASMTVSIFPTGSIRFRPGASAPYTDSLSHVWAPGIQGTGGSLGCCGDLSGGPWGAFTDKQLYYYELFSYNDQFLNFILPNGAYRITEKFGTDQASAGLALLNLEAQGTIAYPDKDIFVLAGGTYKPLDFTLIAIVTNNQLQIVMRHDKAHASRAIINAIQIDATTLGTTIAPGMKWAAGTQTQ